MFHKIYKKFIKQHSDYKKNHENFSSFLFFLISRFKRKYFNTAFSAYYILWSNKNKIRESDLKSIKLNIDKLIKKPTISVLVPIYKPNIDFFTKMLDSVTNQAYENWELCLSDDNSPNQKDVREVIEKYRIKFPHKIKATFRQVNGHISANSNTALELATGEYTCLLDHDDELTINALYELAYAINEYPSVDFLYTDEDKLSPHGHLCEPHFKPSFCLDNLLSRNYITHLSCFRTEMMREIGAFRIGYEGSQDYDIILRMTNRTNNIKHIPKILYHWRMHSESTALNGEAKTYAFDAGVRALTDYFKVREIDATVSKHPTFTGFYEVSFAIDHSPNISAFIVDPEIEFLHDTLEELKFQSYSKMGVTIVLTSLSNTYHRQINEIIHVYNYFEINVVSLDLNKQSTFQINNLLSNAKGEVLLLIRCGAKSKEKQLWLRQMLSNSLRKDIGCVGLKLVDKKDCIKSAGIIIGKGNVIAEAFEGIDNKQPSYFNYACSPSNFDAINSSFVMFRKSIFCEMSTYDLSFNSDLRHIDLCLTMKQSGYRHVVLSHLEMISASKTWYTNKMAERHTYEAEMKHLFKKWGELSNRKFLQDSNDWIMDDYFKLNTFKKMQLFFSGIFKEMSEIKSEY